MIPDNIERKHILSVLKNLQKSKDFPVFRSSTHYDVLFEGRRYPPKYVVSIANKYINGNELESNSFTGGAETNKFLINKGFDIVLKDWKDSENELIVKDYFTMLDLELRGVKFNKAEHIKALRPLLNERASSLIEFKYQNISAILNSMMLPYISGYEPILNFQDSLAYIIVKHIESKEFLHIAEDQNIGGTAPTNILDAKVLPPETNEVDSNIQTFTKKLSRGRS